jgi:RimJ/RimL family protein N-acetyltransferase
MKIISEALPTIYLQSINLQDANMQYVGWLNDPLVNQYLETRHQTQTLPMVEDFIQNVIANPNEHLFTIRLKGNNRHIGNIKIGSIISNHNIGEVSLFIGEKGFWGKGIAKQAVQLISRFSIETLKLRKLSAGAYRPNKGSTIAFIKSGYSEDAILTEHFILDGQPCDLIKVCFFDRQLNQLPQITITR